MQSGCIGLNQGNHCASHQAPIDQSIGTRRGQIDSILFREAEERRAMRAAHHVLSQRHSDDAHAELRGIIRNIPDPLLGHIRNAHMLLVILQVAILGGDMVSELTVKVILELHFPIRSCSPFSLGSFLLLRLTTKTTPS